MTNLIGELSIDELGVVSGGGDDFTFGCMLQLESARREGERPSTVASNQVSGSQSPPKPTPIIRL